MSDFSRSLYEQHLDEAAFLYAQRLALFDNLETTWMRIGEFEERLEARIDALATGGEPALAFCIQYMQAGEVEHGGLYAALCLFCRVGRKDLILHALQGLDLENGDFLLAISDALKHAMPSEWISDLLPLSTELPQVTRVLVRLAGYGHLPLGAALVKMLPLKEAEEAAEIIWALGRLNNQEARPLLISKYLEAQDESIAISSSLALLRMGEQEALNRCLLSAGSREWPNILLGIGAGRSAVPVLLNKVNQDSPATNCLLGLGLLGDIAAIEPLLKHLAIAELAESAALGLNLITGGELYEQVFVPDEIDEDELFPEELEKFRQGQPPTRTDGKPFGISIIRLSQGHEAWRAWWSQNRARFSPGIRYRGGKPFTLGSLLENLEFEKTPYKLRQLAYEELVIRYGKDFPFEADMLVNRQKQVLADISRWVTSEGTRFKEGLWYFAGQPIA